MRPYIVLGLPRCRTAWLAAFLSRPGRRCVHEPSKGYTGLADLETALADDAAAISDSMLTLRWRDILAQRPDARLVVVHRPAREIVASFARIGLGHPRLPALLRRMLEEITVLRTQALVLSVPMADMAREDICASIYRWCHEAEMPPGHWDAWQRVHVEADIDEMLEVCERNRAGIRATFPELTDGSIRGAVS